MGLEGVVLARVGAEHILLTDGDPEALGNCCHNLAQNGITVNDATSSVGLACRSDEQVMGCELLVADSCVVWLVHDL